MAIYRWGSRNPWEELVRLQDDMTRMLHTMSEQTEPNAWPPVNIYDDGETFHVRAELAGLDKDKLEVNVAGDVLTLKAERTTGDVRGSYHRRERGWERFDRSLALPDAVDVDHVKATYKNGILEVFLPRAPEARPRKITIEAR